MSFYDEEKPAVSPGHRSQTFECLAEKSAAVPLSNGRRSVRTLPFSENTFRLITETFYVHHSISPVISRADIPMFSATEVDMEDPKGSTHLARGMFRDFRNDLWQE